MRMMKIHAPVIRDHIARQGNEFQHPLQRLRLKGIRCGNKVCIMASLHPPIPLKVADFIFSFPQTSKTQLMISSPLSMRI
jgi:hypothetical protein